MDTVSEEVRLKQQSGTNSDAENKQKIPIPALRPACLVAKFCPILCDPMDCSPSGSSVLGFLRQEYWSGLPLPSPRDLPDHRTNFLISGTCWA